MNSWKLLYEEKACDIVSYATKYYKEINKYCVIKPEIVSVSIGLFRIQNPVKRLRWSVTIITR